MNIVLLAFLLSLALIVMVGLFAIRRQRDDVSDYLIAGRSVGPWLTALSSVATNNSGFMFVGLIGFTYRFGLHTIWMAIAWIIGDFLVWQWVHPRVRAVSEQVHANSVPTFIGKHSPHQEQRLVTIVAAILTIIFLGGYAAAQLNAGSTALSGLFGWDRSTGAILGALIVVGYCFSGGLRASIWTDAAQSLIMLGSMIAVVFSAGFHVGGPAELFSQLRTQDPSLVELFPPDLRFGFPLYVLGFVAGGVGAIGAPHILIRSMAAQNVDIVRKAKRVYYAWFIPFYALAIVAALYARALIPDLLTRSAAATEGALISLSQVVLPDFWVGLMLAGLFAATMSTADSQILVCSAAITQDIRQDQRHSKTAAKIATLLVTSIALTIALIESDSVFALVLSAWSALGSSLGPMVVLRSFRRPVPQKTAIAMMLGGAVTSLLWEHSPWNSDIYCLLPGLIVPTFIYFIGRRLEGARRSSL